MSRDDTEDYDNRNKAFLQAFMARSTLTFEEAKPILAAIFGTHEHREILPEDITTHDFNTYISAANQALSPFDMEIRSTLHQKTRDRVYALVNSTSDPMTQLATSFTPDEIAFLKRVLDAMFETNNKPRREVLAIKSMQAMQLAKVTGANRGGRRRVSDEDGETVQADEDGDTQADATQTQTSSVNGLTLSQAEKTLTGLVDQGWFEKSKRGYYSLSPRALMELRGWLTETYNDPDDSEDEGDNEERQLKIKFCYACKEIVTRGQRCPDWRCSCRIHDICVNGLFTGRQKVCPVCKKEWDGEHFVGERADR